MTRPEVYKTGPTVPISVDDDGTPLCPFHGDRMVPEGRTGDGRTVYACPTETELFRTAALELAAVADALMGEEADPCP